mgnify:FL=1
MKILSIETSCDETALALIEAKGGLKKPRFKILKNLVASQIKIHQPFGGIVPNLAKREHIKNLPILLKKLATSGCWLSPDLIAVTVGPGLEPCLWTGIEFAKDLAKKRNKPLLGVNHLEGHLYSFLLSQKNLNSKKIFPAVALIVSGGHTILLLMKDLIHYKKLGETRDDAAGEAFDKVARLLNLPYPGGPNLEKIAKQGNANAVNFPRPMIYQKNYDFSFSGLKTAVLYYLKNQTKAKNLFGANIAEAEQKISERVENLTGTRERSELGGKFSSGARLDFIQRRRMSEKRFLADTAAGFQEAVIDALTAKTFRAAKEFKARSILLSGGVANNKALRQNFRREARKKKINFLAPSLEFTTDNAAMTAIAAYFSHLKNKKYPLKARSDINFI